jgi:hypothetical protein
MRTDPLAAAVPRGILLDTMIVNYLAKYGGFMWDGQELPEDLPRQLQGQLESLRMLMRISARASLPFALSRAVLAEARSAFPWSIELDSYWQQLRRDYSIEDRRPLPAGTWDFAPVSDRPILEEAWASGCQAVLTNDRRLLSQQRQVRALRLGLLLITPTQLWDRLSPWAGLWL